jgi:hypothetical protein
MVITRRTMCTSDTIADLRRYELCLIETRLEMMRLCRLVEKAVRDGEISFEKADRHYLSRIRLVNKMTYRHLNMSRVLRYELFELRTTRIHNDSYESKKITKRLGMFNTLTEMMYQIIHHIKSNMIFEEVYS